MSVSTFSPLASRSAAVEPLSLRILLDFNFLIIPSLETKWICMNTNAFLPLLPLARSLRRPRAHKQTQACARTSLISS